VTAARLWIFVVAYLLIAFPRVGGLRLTRPAAALIGAAAMVTLGRLPLADAYRSIDLDVLSFLLGVLIVAAYLEVGGFFEWAAARVVARARSPRALLAAVVIVTGLLSALFTNDTLCIVMPALVLAVLAPLRLPPLPYLLAIGLAANIGSAMAITGNPQNMLIGLSSHLAFGRFLVLLAPASVGGLVIVYVALALRYRRALRHEAPPIVAAAAVELDRWLVSTALLVFVGMLACWLAGLSLPLVAIAGAGVVTLIARRDASAAYAKVDWPLLLFFAALFVIVRGVQDVPAVHDVTTIAVAQLRGNRWHDGAAVSGAMLVLSNLVSNVPAVLLWRPVVPTLPHANFVWLVMAMSSTFAGNLSLLGSMANMIVAERAQARGVPIPFLDYLMVGIPVTLLTIGWGLVTLVWLDPAGPIPR
jgi:Na+/H+ antiporter NhaD/arsenite permease-like protein